MSSFEYRSLIPQKGRIRLIDVLPETHHPSVERLLDQHNDDQAPSESNKPVSCTLSYFSLDAAPAYTALSYSWGDPAQVVGILVNGTTMMVTTNLEAALRHLRLQDKPLTLWIDALCIDQNNDVEKTEQLEQMQKIYAQAISVIAWLGPTADNSDIALYWIQQYGERSLELGIGTKPELRLRHLLEALEATGKGLLNARLKEFTEDLKKDLPPTDLGHADIITALSKLFKRPYWTRIWVVQELNSAAKLTFMCGNIMVKDDHLDHALRLLRNFGQYRHLQRTPNSPTTHPPKVSVNSIDTYDPINLMKFRKAAVRPPLVHIMRTFRYFQATDPRDKIFALLGIAKDTEALGLHPDCSKSCQEVYTTIARTLIQNGNIELLSLCEFPKQIDGLPSWVHDWSAKSYRGPLQQRSLNRRVLPMTTFLEPKFSASGTSQTVSLGGGHTTSWEMPLLLRATFLGEVQQVRTIWEPDSFGRWLFDLKQLSDLIPDTSIPSGGRAHAVWRTAVADQEVRQGIGKPRLSEEKLRIVSEALKGVNMSVMDEQKFLQAGLGDYCEQLRVVAEGRRPLFVSGGYLGIGPCETEQGDLVFILLGADTPYILRRRSQDNTLQLIGEAYVHGIMDGEAMEGSPDIEEIALS